jgi:hypothetical protein
MAHLVENLVDYSIIAANGAILELFCDVHPLDLIDEVDRSTQSGDADALASAWVRIRRIQDKYVDKIREQATRAGQDAETSDGVGPAVARAAENYIQWENAALENVSRSLAATSAAFAAADVAVAAATRTLAEQGWTAASPLAPLVDTDASCHLLRQAENLNQASIRLANALRARTAVYKTCKEVVILRDIVTETARRARAARREAVLQGERDKERGAAAGDKRKRLDGGSGSSSPGRAHRRSPRGSARGGARGSARGSAQSSAKHARR